MNKYQSLKPKELDPLLQYLLLSGFFWPRSTACGILVPRPGMEPMPPAVEAQSPNHWTTREFPLFITFQRKTSYMLYFSTTIWERRVHDR